MRLDHIAAQQTLAAVETRAEEKAGELAEQRRRLTTLTATLEELQTQQSNLRNRLQK